jgi:ubiquitin-protein ligase E3 A
MNGESFKLFEWQELELLICGLPELDFQELENNTTYENGLSEEHQTIKYFWEVVHGLNLE